MASTGESRDRRMPAAGGHLRHRLQDPPLRRADRRGLRFEPNPAEVESVLVASLEDLRAGYGKRRLVRRGMPIKTDSYVVGDALIWGATARILGDLLERLNRIKEAV